MHLRRGAEVTLGVDQKRMQLHAFRLQADVYKRMTSHSKGDPGGVKGLFKVSKKGQSRLNGFLFPKGPKSQLPKWQTTALETFVSLAERGDRWLAQRGP